MKRSHALMRCAQMGINLSAQQQALMLYAEANGLVFCADFGYQTTRQRIDQEIMLKQVRQWTSKKAAS
jgi:hypothetical protein